MRSSNDKFADLLVRCFNAPAAPWPTDWNAADAQQFLEFLPHQGMGPLFWQILHDAGRLDHWPQVIRDGLSTMVRRLAALDLLRRQAVNQVLAALHAHGVEPLLMKGVPLAYTIYPEPWLRPVSDVDLLIPADQVAGTRKIFDELGFVRPPSAEGELILHQFMATQNDAAGMAQVFDVHWKISNTNVFADMLPYDELFAERIAVPALGEAAFTLSNRHALLLACIHRVGHHANSRRLIWLYDIHLLAQQMSDVQARDFVNLARDKRAWRICADGITLAREAFATGLDPVLAEAVDNAPGFPREPSALYLRPQATLLKRIGFDLVTTRGWHRKLLLLWRQVFPSAAYMAARHGARGPWQLALGYARRFVSGLHRLMMPPPQ